MDALAYERLFKKLGFTAFEHRKLLRHPKLNVSLYFNANADGVWFTGYAKDFRAYPCLHWTLEVARQVKDARAGFITVVPREGKELAAFRELINYLPG